MNVVQPENAHKFVQAHIDSSQWWVIPIASEYGLALASRMAEQINAGDIAPLIHIAAVPNAVPEMPLFFLILAAKSVISAKKLSELMHAPLPEDGSRDVVVPPNTPVSVVLWLGTHFRWDQQ